MSVLKYIFGKKTPTSTALAAEIEKARAERDNAVEKRGAALAGLGTMSEAEHVQAEAAYETHRRAADRAEARVADLETALADALAVEAVAEEQAEAERFRSRVEAARNAVEVESAKLLLIFDERASAIADVLARLGELEAERQAVNEAGRCVPGFEPVRSIDEAHRKHPDQPEAVVTEPRQCWVYRYPGSPRDTERLKFQREAAREEVVEATINPNTGKAIPVPAARHDYYGRELIIVPTLETREIVVSRANYRPGRYEVSLTGIVLPAGFAGGTAHWPRS